MVLPITRYAIRDTRLKSLVNFIWCLETKTSVSIHHKLLPTASIDIILNLSEKICYEIEGQQVEAGDMFLNGVRNKSASIIQKGKLKVWGISFFPFGLYPFIKIPLTNFSNGIVNIENFSRKFADNLNVAVFSTVQKDEIPKCIEKILLSMLEMEAQEVKTIGMVRAFLGANASVSSFCNHYAINEKTLERNFLKYTGYTPKILTRIERFQKSCNQLLFISKTPNFAELAQNNDYYDQSHFMREFKDFTGTTPTGFIVKKDSIKENTNYFYL